MVVTNAHVIAGEANPTLVIHSIAVPATPVLVDPELDVAVLKVAAPLGAPLSFDAALAPRGTQAAVVGFPLNGDLHITGAGISASFDAVGRDIYGAALVTRQVYELSASIEPGDSGSPLVVAGGHVLGIVFSRSSVASGVGYALTAAAVAPTIARAAPLTRRVSTGTCTPG
jgi:S1-C subfamily serine protease